MPVGVLSTAEPLQKYPAAQGPLGTESPVLAQNWPAGHAWHSLKLMRPVALLYVPTGQGWCVLELVLSGQ